MAVRFLGVGQGLFRLFLEKIGEILLSEKKGLIICGGGATQKLEVQQLNLFCLCSHGTTARPAIPRELWPGRKLFGEGTHSTGGATFPFLTENEKMRVGGW